jgi:hypothetical protein
MTGSSRPPTDSSIPTGGDLAFAGVARLAGFDEDGLPWQG